MIQLGESSSFFQEATAQRGIRGKSWKKDLNSNRPAQAFIFRQINTPHSSGAEPAQKLIAGKRI